MGCTKCKKKIGFSASTSVNIIEVKVDSQYKLRDGISWDQLGYTNPSDADIETFLKLNPNRKSLFAVLPDNMKKGMSKDNENQVN